jgi:anti-sigma factor RsiW
VTCEQARDLAALAASGDITQAELSALESHNAICSKCRAETEAFEIMCGQLAGMREESAPEHVYSAVRARVAAEISHRRRPGWTAAWVGFAVAATSGLLVAIMLRFPAPVVKQPVASAPVEAASVQTDSPDVFVPSPKRRVRRTAMRTKAPVPAEPLVVHMFTSDPDVVIYWIADARGISSKKEIIQ